MWIDKEIELTDKTLKVFFDFQFFPGENNKNQRGGTANGFVATLLAGNVPLKDDEGRVMCGASGAKLGYQMMNAEDGLEYNPDMFYNINPTPKVGLEFDIYYDYLLNDPGVNHVAFLNAYNVRHGDDLNPVCYPYTGSNMYDKHRGCVHRGDASGKTTETNPKRIWLEAQLKNKKTKKHGKPGDDYGILDDNTKTRVHSVRMEVKRRCLYGCTSCGQTSNPNAYYAYIKAYIDCDKDKCGNLDEDYSVQNSYYERTIDYCYKEPLRKQGVMNDENYFGDYSFDTVKLGFTSSMTTMHKGEIGVLIRNIYAKTYP